jgi:heme/copper-type cytochrome/quinol oxidase subunit 2
MSFQNSIFSFYMDDFHNFNCALLVGVLMFVTFVFIFLIVNKSLFKSFNLEYQFGELLCSIFPTLILLFQMVPSLSLLYYYGLISLDSDLTVKVIGHQ